MRAFARRVLLDVRMAIEMVVGEIEPERDPRPERRGGLELKAADLDGVDRLGRRVFDLRRERHADVAAHEHSLAVRRNHSSKQRRRRGLPFRSRHRDHATAKPSRCELHFSDDFHSARASRDQTRLVWRHSRARDDEIGRRRTSRRCGHRALPRCPHAAAQTPARSPRVVQSSTPAPLAGEAVPPPQCRFAPLRQPPLAALEPKSRHLPHHHRSFNVVRLKSAKITATIRNRVMTFGSLQPRSSK